MRILFLNIMPFRPQNGGIERVTDIIARYLNAQGHHIYYLTWKGSDQEYDVNIPQVEKEFFFPSECPFDKTENKECYLSILDTYHIDVVINQRGLSNIFDDALTCRKNVKKISVIHSVIDADVKAELIRSMVRHNTTIGNLKHIIKIISYPFYRVYKKYSLYHDLAKHYRHLQLNSDTIVVLSSPYGKELKRLTGINSKIISIPNPLTQFETTEQVGKEKNILFVGRLSRIEKNPMRLLKVWKKLQDRYHEWKLVIVGDGECRIEMEKFIRDNKLKRVVLNGQQSQVVRYYQKARFICLTSNFEGWGMSLVEGMSFGCIPVCFNTSSAATDIIDDGTDGCLVKPFNLEKYAQRIREIIDDENKMIKMSAAAIRKVQKFDISRVGQEWSDLLEKTLND